MERKASNELSDLSDDEKIVPPKMIDSDEDTTLQARRSLNLTRKRYVAESRETEAKAKSVLFFSDVKPKRGESLDLATMGKKTSSEKARQGSKVAWTTSVSCPDTILRSQSIRAEEHASARVEDDCIEFDDSSSASSSP